MVKKHFSTIFLRNKSLNSIIEICKVTTKNWDHIKFIYKKIQNCLASFLDYCYKPWMGQISILSLINLY